MQKAKARQFSTNALKIDEGNRKQKATEKKEWVLPKKARTIKKLYLNKQCKETGNKISARRIRY